MEARSHPFWLGLIVAASSSAPIVASECDLSDPSAFQLEEPFVVEENSQLSSFEQAFGCTLSVPDLTVFGDDGSAIGKVVGLWGADDKTGFEVKTYLIVKPEVQQSLAYAIAASEVEISSDNAMVVASYNGPDDFLARYNPTGTYTSKDVFGPEIGSLSETPESRRVLASLALPFGFNFNVDKPFEVTFRSNPAKAMVSWQGENKVPTEMKMLLTKAQLQDVVLRLDGYADCTISSMRHLTTGPSKQDTSCDLHPLAQTTQ